MLARGKSETPAYPTLITAAVAVCLVDRVDVFAGAGPFGLTPFLLLSPILVLTAVFGRRPARPTLERPPFVKLAPGGVLVYAFVCLAGLSVMIGSTSKGLARYALLVLLIAATWSLVSLIARTGNIQAVRRGALIGLLIYAAFDVWQWTLYQQYGLFGPDFVGIFSAGLTPYGEGIVRLSGGATDSNRAAMAIATYTYLLLADPATKRPRVDAKSYGILALGLLLTALTISRSGTAAFLLIMVGALAAFFRNQNDTQRILFGAVLTGAVVSVFTSGLLDRLGVTSIVGRRLNLDEGSATSHLALIERGWEQGTSSWKMFTGHGWGESYLLLQDVFPNNPYGNYHSLYITTLVEAGIFALLVVLALLIPPLAGPRRWLAAGVVFFGVFYQGASDPIFWFSVALLWSNLGQEGADDESPRTETVGDRRGHRPAGRDVHHGDRDRVASA